MRFEKIELEENEAIIAIVRRHWFYVFKQAFVIAILVLLPLFAFLCMHFLLDPLQRTLLYSFAPHFFFLCALWVLIQWMLLAAIWTDHYLDTWTITNLRIIKVDQVGLFKRRIGSFRLERLQDINVEINGIIATLLDYGTIHAETASGHDEEFSASYMPHPQEIKALILKAADKRIHGGADSL
jgi:uncharacterized membrane protein YdbT with pleckstrin-like domain